MAPDVLSLLKASNSWIDPNLIALISTSSRKKDKLDKKSTKKKLDGMLKRNNESIGTSKADGSARKRQRRGGVKNRAKREIQNAKNISLFDVEHKNKIHDQLLSDDDVGNEFSHLLGNRIVLKRAENVSDPDDSADDED